MSKQKLLLAVIGVFIMSAGAGALLTLHLTTKPPSVLSKSAPAPAPTTAPEVKPDAVYQDESGFSFKYPKDVRINDITPEDDQSYYSLLSVQKGSSSLFITIKDVQYEKVQDWLENAPDAPKQPILIGAVVLGGMAANQYVSEGKLYTLAIDQKVLFAVESPSNPYWDKVHGLVVESFSLGNDGNNNTPQGPQTSSDKVIYEPEEIIE